MSVKTLSPRGNDDDHVEQVVSLLPFELSMPIMQQQFSTASLTWYQMEKDQTLEGVAMSVRERLTQVMEANPWLGGRIKTRNGQAAIVYTPVQSKKQVDTILTVYDGTVTPIDVSMNMPYPELSAKLQRTVVPLTFWWVWQWNVPFFRVALVPDCNNPARFALITSLAHCVGDGQTYYNLHNMLACKNAQIVPLLVQRKHYLHDAMTQTMGGPAFFDVYCQPSLGFIVRIIRSILVALLFGPPTVVKLFRVNNDWIKEQKKVGLLTSTNKDNNKLAASQSPPKFLSSNDVMASQFLNTTRCDQALMTVNFRGKIQDCHETDAGNYYNFNPLQSPDFGHPTGIRRVVDQLKRGQREFPTTPPMTSFQHLSSFTRPVSFFTNWCDFARPVPLAQCQELVHMPLVPTHSWRMPARLFSFCYVFKPDKDCNDKANANNLAVLVSATPQAMKELEATGMMGPELVKSKGM